jgi:hypothetical protein
MEVSPCPGVSALDVTLSRHSGVIDRGNVYGLLTECLQDVSFVILMPHIFSSYCLVLNSRLFHNRLIV